MMPLVFLRFFFSPKGVLRSGNTECHITAKIDLLSSQLFLLSMSWQLSKEENYHVFLCDLISPKKILKPIENAIYLTFYCILIGCNILSYFFFIWLLMWLSELYDTNKNNSLDSLIYSFGYLAYWISEISLYFLSSLVKYSVDFSPEV